jgi:hypothetical protein
MDEKYLRDHLDLLSQEVENLPLGDSARDRLNRLIADLKPHEEAGSKPPSDVIENIDNMVVHFETEHPTVTGVLNNILITLSNMGV